MMPDETTDLFDGSTVSVWVWVVSWNWAAALSVAAATWAAFPVSSVKATAMLWIRRTDLPRAST